MTEEDITDEEIERVEEIITGANKKMEKIKEKQDGIEKNNNRLTDFVSSHIRSNVDIPRATKEQLEESDGYERMFKWDAAFKGEYYPSSEAFMITKWSMPHKEFEASIWVHNEEDHGPWSFQVECPDGLILAESHKSLLTCCKALSSTMYALKVSV